MRNAHEQVRGLYGRQVEIFPPQVLDVADTYFSKEVPIDRDNPGPALRRGQRPGRAPVQRRDPGRRGAAVGGAAAVRPGRRRRRPVHDAGRATSTPPASWPAWRATWPTTCRTGSSNPRKDSGFPRRFGTAFGSLNIGELTSRIASAEIGETLDRLGLEFDPDYDTTDAVRASGSPSSDAGKKVADAQGRSPFDVVLATSMLQVGVDVQRLGLMLVVGQPKNTAEYIQASSRVGRDASDRPGLVVSLGNWARPRDLAHFEQFRHYHETFYAQVEALSVTPYSPTSLARGIDGLLVSAARVAQAAVADGLSPGARRVADQGPASGGRGAHRAAQGSGSPRPPRATTRPSAPATCWSTGSTGGASGPSAPPR